MAPRALRTHRRAPRKGRIMDVRVTDSAAGSDGAKCDRQIAALKASEAQTRILVGEVVDINQTTTAVTGIWDFNSLYGTDEFQNMIQEFTMFRVVSIRFDVVDLNPNAPAVNVFGTFHDDYTGTAPTYTRANITDQADSTIISPGLGVKSFTWMAHGIEEGRFQSGQSTGTTASKFGGLRWYVLGSTSGPKYTLNVHAVVDFRGRL